MRRAAPKIASGKTAAAKAPAKPGTASAKTKSGSARPVAAKSRTATSAHAPAAGSKGKRRRTVARRPPSQQQPTADRYKEIQQALADRGYFHGVPDGNWGPESADALKRFQMEQNLDADGKIGALSLMALGLGPQRGTASAQAAKAPEGSAGAAPGSALPGGAPGAAMPVDPPPVAQPEP